MSQDERTRIPPKHAAPCDFCHNLLDIRARGVHQWTSGWVMQRAAGGGHGITCPQRAERWAHAECVRKAADRHVDPDQLELFR